jgi:hypothetical protein
MRYSKLFDSGYSPIINDHYVFNKTIPFHNVPFSPCLEATYGSIMR